MADLNFDIGAKYREAASAFKELAGGVDEFQRKLKELDRVRANPRVDLATREAEQKLTGLKSELRNLKNVKLQIDADTAGVKASINGVERELERLRKQPASVEVTARTAIAETRINQLKAQLTTLKDARINVDANTARAKAQIAALETQLARLSDKSVTVDVDTRGSTDRLRALASESDKTGSALQRLASVGTGSVSTRFGLMAAAALPVLESLGQLSGALGLIPAVAMGAGTAFATVAVGVQGLGTAFKSNTKLMELSSIITEGNVRALEGQRGAAKAVATATKAYDKELVKYQATLTGLAPSARDFVIQTLALGPAFSAVKLDVQQQLFEGFGRTLKELGATALPVIRGGLVQMASGMNEAALNVGKFATSKQAVADYTTIFDNIGSSARILAGAVQPVLQIFTDVALVGSEFLPGMATSFADAAQKAADFVSRARETGQLREWIQTGIDAVKLLWGALVDVIAIIKELATNSPFGPNFLEALKMVTGSIRWLIENVPGLTSVVNLFFAAWLFAKIAGGLAGMVTTIGTVAGALTGATGAAKGFGAASTTAGGAAVAGAGKAKSAWVTAGLAIAGAFVVGELLKTFGKDITDAATLASSGFWDKFRDGMDTAGKLFTGDFKGFAEGIKTSWDASMIQMEQRTNEYSTTTSGVISGLLAKIGLWFADPKTVTFNADPDPVITAAVAALFAVQTVPESRATTFTGDISQLSPQAATAVAQINAAPQTWLTMFGADVIGIVAGAGQATGAANSVPKFPPPTVFGGDANPVVGEAGRAGGAINGVPPGPNTPFTGDASGVVGEAGRAGDAINGIPRPGPVRIDAQDNASGVIERIGRLLDGINGRTVRTFVDTVYRTFTGQAAGGILAPMAAGGVLPMASGDALLDRARPMSGRSARIVPPNTPRLIGDRMRDDEAFVPINGSLRSEVILGQAANRMGFALAPLAPLTPMAHGGINNLRDEKAWEWIAQLLQSLRGRPRGGGGFPGAPGGGLTQPGTPGPAPTGRAMERTLTSRFQVAGGVASMTRANPLYSPTPYRPFAPDPRGPGRDLSNLSFGPTGSRWLDGLLEEVAEKIRGRGGNSQIMYSRR